MSERNTPFLKLTFDGGRFSGHSLPVDALAELVAVQALISEVAAGLIRSQQSRAHVPQGFRDAAILHLALIEDNCVTANLIRPSERTWESKGEQGLDIFEQAREVSLQALVCVEEGQYLPEEFPPAAIRELAAIGKKLGDEEHLILKSTARATSARVDQRIRKNIEKLLERPPEMRVLVLASGPFDFEGEVESIDDASNNCSLYGRSGDRINAKFRGIHRNSLVKALASRPIRLVRVRGEARHVRVGYDP